MSEILSLPWWAWAMLAGGLALLVPASVWSALLARLGPSAATTPAAQPAAGRVDCPVEPYLVAWLAVRDRLKQTGQADAWESSLANLLGALTFEPQAGRVAGLVRPTAAAPTAAAPDPAQPNQEKAAP